MFVILFVTYYGLLQSKIFFLERTFPALSKEIYIAFHAAVNTGWDMIFYLNKVNFAIFGSEGNKLSMLTIAS